MGEEVADPGPPGEPPERTRGCPPPPREGLVAVHDDDHVGGPAPAEGTDGPGDVAAVGRVALEAFDELDAAAPELDREFLALTGADAGQQRDLTAPGGELGDVPHGREPVATGIRLHDQGQWHRIVAPLGGEEVGPWEQGRRAGTLAGAAISR